MSGHTEVNSPPPSATDFWDLLSLDIAHARADSLYLIDYVPESAADSLTQYAPTAPLPLNGLLRVHDRHRSILTDDGTFLIALTCGLPAEDFRTISRDFATHARDQLAALSTRTDD